MRFGLLGTVLVHDGAAPGLRAAAAYPAGGAPARTEPRHLTLPPGRPRLERRPAGLRRHDPAQLRAAAAPRSRAGRRRPDPDAVAGISGRCGGWRARRGGVRRAPAAELRHVEAGRWDEARASCVAALALWRDDPLADLDPPAAWSEEIHRLQEARLQTVEARIEADLRLGAHAAVVTDLAGLIAEHPFRETPASQLMLALYRTGRQSEALAVSQPRPPRLRRVDRRSTGPARSEAAGPGQ